MSETGNAGGGLFNLLNINTRTKVVTLREKDQCVFTSRDVVL